MNPITPLLGPRLKLARANRHIRDFESLIETFVCNNPYTLHPENYPDGFGVRADFGSELPGETPTIIGDAIHNLRAALDHLASDMIRASGTEPTRYHGFPIYEKEADFKGGLTSKMQGARPDFVSFMEAKRPYRDNGGNAWLHDLSKLDNDDKHIVLTPTIAVRTIKNVSIKTEAGGCLTIGELSFGGNGHVNLFGSCDKVTKIEADKQSAFRVEFSGGPLKGLPITDTLRNFSSGVGGIIEDASKLF